MTCSRRPNVPSLLPEILMLPLPLHPTFLPPIARPNGRTEDPLAGWLAAIVDEIDYPVLLVNSQLDVLHANRTADAELGDDHPLQVDGRRLRARSAHDALALRDSIDSAFQRGLRKLLPLSGGGENGAWLSVLPLRGPATDDGADTSAQVVMLVMSKRRMWQPLSVQSFSRMLRLTDAETSVLQGLCDGMQPHEVADRHNVAVSTVRTQINSLRGKMGAGSICEVVRRVAMLPPILGVLRSCNRAGLNGPPKTAQNEQSIVLHA
jgi:DNA-binding CsgD family transcriptional regulator